MLSHFSHVWLCNPMDCSPLVSSVHKIFLARILEWVAMPCSRGSSQPKDQTHMSCISCIAGGFFCFHCRQLLEIAFMSQHFLSSFVLQMELVIMGCVSDMHAQSLQLCPTLCHPVDCSSPGSSVHGILQARTLEWVAMPSSRGSPWPRDRTCVSYVSCTGRHSSLPLAPPGKLHPHSIVLTAWADFCI